jgi:hypothetical protein
MPGLELNFGVAPCVYYMGYVKGFVGMEPSHLSRRRDEWGAPVSLGWIAAASKIRGFFAALRMTNFGGIIRVLLFG